MDDWRIVEPRGKVSQRFMCEIRDHRMRCTECDGEVLPEHYPECSLCGCDVFSVDYGGRLFKYRMGLPPVERVVRDGKVAVVFTFDLAGWWPEDFGCDNHEQWEDVLRVHPKIVEVAEEGGAISAELLREVTGWDGWTEGSSSCAKLLVAWVPVGSSFRVNRKYSDTGGEWEEVEVLNEKSWIKA